MSDSDIWKYLKDRMNEKVKTPDYMVRSTGSKLFYGIDSLGETHVSDDLLRKAIFALDLYELRDTAKSAAQKEITKKLRLERMSRDELLNLIKPAPGMPLGNGNIWDKLDE
jgi:uncharacterized membrane-anchored protein YjiN (DUF445 family)